MEVVGNMKNFRLVSACLTAALLCTSAFSQTGGKNPPVITDQCSKSGLKTTIFASKPRLLSVNSTDTDVLEVDEKTRGRRYLTWNFVPNGIGASVACYRGSLIAVQLVPRDADCLISFLKKAGADDKLRPPVVEKLLCE